MVNDQLLSLLEEIRDGIYDVQRILSEDTSYVSSNLQDRIESDNQRDVSPWT